MASTAALLLLIPQSGGASAAEPVDVARTGTPTAASEFPDPRFVVEHVNDGDLATRWGSNYAHGLPEYPDIGYDPSNDWVQIELASPSPVGRVVLDWETARPDRYVIQTSSDGQSWTNVQEVSNPAVGVNVHEMTITDPVLFVRVQTLVLSSPWGLSLWSFEIWDSPGSVIPEPDPDDWEYGVDVARTGIAEAASVYTGLPEQRAARLAIDGNSSSRWGSDYPRDGIIEPPASDHDPSSDWIQVQLAEPSPVWSVVLNWEFARPSQFALQVSNDGENWTTVREVKSTPIIGVTEYVLGVVEPVSFVRMQGVATATQYGYSLWDFEIWSGPEAPLPPPAPGGVVVPAPVSLTEGEGAPFELAQESRIVASGNAAVEAELLAQALRPATGFPLPVVAAETGRHDITLVLGDEEAPTGSDLAAQEGYTMSASAAGVRIGAATGHGLFNAGRTLLQLLPAEIVGATVRPGPWLIDAVEIVDYPRFGHRGVMLDPARNFIEVQGVLDVIDELAAMKGNRLHMHLSDDQGWRIEIDSWPRLTEVGGPMSMPGGRSGFYTKEQFQQIVEYADQRHIVVTPEIDVPGHSSAAIAAYPELACGSSGTLCPTAPIVAEFIDDVIGEIAPLTNSDMFHIGGDESISGEPYIQFIKLVEGIVRSHDLRMVGWTPVPMAGLEPDSIHQYWRDQSFEMEPEWFDNANDVILSPTAEVYLDYPYPQFDSLSTHDWDPYTVVDDYRLAPLSDWGLKEENIIGIEGPAWGENNSGGIVDVQHKVFPRLAAVLDLAWSPRELTTDSRSFLERLAVQGARWQFAGTNFWPDPDVAWQHRLAGTVHPLGADGVVSGAMATFATPTIPIGQLSASIDWGDGTSSAGELAGSVAAGKLGNSLYEVLGSHTYMGAGPWQGEVQLDGPDGQAWTATFTVGAEVSCSVLRPTVIIGGVDTGVVNTETPDGCLDELIDEHGEYPTHGHFVMHVNQVLDSLGGLSGSDRGKLVRVAAASGVGK
ncbi:family 20 glycosylhydrolase [Tessaracoccus sp. Y36]